MRELTTLIRTHLDGPRPSYTLRKNPGIWIQLCSSLDVIEDTGLAIGAYSICDPPVTTQKSDYGFRYLALYGLLQALFVQQDAVLHLCEALGVPCDLNEYPRLTTIRDVRNASTGHPTKRGPKSHRSHHFISRISLRRGGFKLQSAYPERNDKFETIDVEELIAHQREDINRIASTIVAELERRAEGHKTNSMSDRLGDAFPEMLSYGFEKLSEAAHGSSPPDMGTWPIDQVEQAMRDFRDCLVRQDMELDTFGSVELLFGELNYALPELKKYFQGQESDIPSQQMACIVTFFIRQKVQELRDLAREIDEESNDSEDLRTDI